MAGGSRKAKPLPVGSAKSRPSAKATPPTRPPPLHTLFGNDPIDPQRSSTMSKIRGKNTGPELRLRRAVWAAGGRFRVHVRGLPGTPDLANKKARVAVFVDGCFWHGCPRHFKPPTTRRNYWVEKIRRNMEKRTNVMDKYDGWTVVQVFECDLAANGDFWARHIAKSLRREGIGGLKAPTPGGRL